MRFVTYTLLYLSLVLTSCRVSPEATTRPESTQTQTPFASPTTEMQIPLASATGVVDTFIWERLQNESPVPIAIYRPTFLPPQYSEAMLDDLPVDSAGEPNYTVVYKAPDAILAFILGTGAGSLGNVPLFQPAMTESLTIADQTATFIVVASQQTSPMAIDVTWQDQGDVYSIRCFGNACDADDVRQTALSMVRVEPDQ